MSKIRHTSKSSSAWKRLTPWWLVAVAIFAVVVLVAVVLLSPPQDEAKSPAQINIDQAYEKYQNDIFFLDVRTPAEWDSVRIPNTTLIPLDQLSARLNEVPQDQEIVVVCRSGNRSQQGRDILRKAGFSQATSMAGGVSAWQAAGYPVETGNP